MPLVLVVGGAGFLGSRLVEALLRAQYHVRVLDDLSTGSLRRLRVAARDAQVTGRSGSRLDFILGDVRDAAVVRKAARGATYVFHEAESRVDGLSGRHLMSVNVEGTLNVLASAQAEGVRRVVCGSSWVIYGDERELPLAETLAPRVRSPYAASKAAAEAYCRAYWEAYRLETICLRYFSLYGPAQPGSSFTGPVVPRFVSALLTGLSPTINGDGQQTRDFVFIDDAVQATVAAAMAPNVAGRCVNVATGQRVSVKQLAEALCMLTGRPVAARFASPRSGDVRHAVGDTRLAATLLGTMPAVPLLDGLQRTVEYYRSTIRGMDVMPGDVGGDTERAHVRC